MNQPCQHYL